MSLRQGEIVMDGEDLEGVFQKSFHLVVHGFGDPVFQFDAMQAQFEYAADYLITTINTVQPPACRNTQHSFYSFLATDLPQSSAKRKQEIITTRSPSANSGPRVARGAESAEMKVFPLAAEPPARGKFRCTSCLWIGASYVCFGGKKALRRANHVLS
jgi:hypothetical protein